MGEPLDRGRRDEERHRDRRAEHRCRRGDVGDVDEDARPEPQRAPCLDVAGEGELVTGAPGVVAERPRLEALLGEALVVGDADRVHAAESIP